MLVSLMNLLLESINKVFTIKVNRDDSSMLGGDISSENSANDEESLTLTFLLS